MAEIRKHQPSTGNAIAQALRAALGEDVRPNVPGEPPTKKRAAASDTAFTSWVTLSFDSEPEEEDEAH